MSDRLQSAVQPAEPVLPANKQLPHSFRALMKVQEFVSAVVRAAKFQQEIKPLGQKYVINCFIKAVKDEQITKMTRRTTNIVNAGGAMV